jgi:hypothetical protein
MSHEPSHSTEHMAPPPEQAEEGIAWGAVIGVALGSLLIFVIAVLVSTRILHVREKALQPLGPDPLPLQVGQGEIGVVDQVPFDVSRALESYRRDRLARLEHWGWIDRKAGAVHMPIADAMELIVKEHAK